MAYSLDTQFPSGIIYTGDLVTPFTVFTATPGVKKRIRGIHLNNTLTATIITFTLSYQDTGQVFALVSVGIGGLAAIGGGIRAYMFSAGFRTDRGVVIAGATGGSATIFHDPDTDSQ